MPYGLFEVPPPYPPSWVSGETISARAGLNSRRGSETGRSVGFFEDGRRRQSLSLQGSPKCTPLPPTLWGLGNGEGQSEALLEFVSEATYKPPPAPGEGRRVGRET